jgi:hypothetical protein
VPPVRRAPLRAELAVVTGLRTRRRRRLLPDVAVVDNGASSERRRAGGAAPRVAPPPPLLDGLVDERDEPLHRRLYLEERKWSGQAKTPRCFILLVSGKWEIGSRAAAACARWLVCSFSNSFTFRRRIRFDPGPAVFSCVCRLPVATVW